jgi:hypothetical protein
MTSDAKPIRIQSLIVIGIGAAFLLAGRTKRQAGGSWDGGSLLDISAQVMDIALPAAVITSGLSAFVVAIVISLYGYGARLLQHLLSRMPRATPPPAQSTLQRQISQGSDRAEAPSNVVAFPTPLGELERWARIEGASVDISYKTLDDDVLIEYSGRAEALERYAFLPNPLYKPNG